MTGLGDVSPGVSDGAAASSNPLSYTNNTITAAVGGTAATVTFAGLAPGFASLYQVNVLIPAGVSTGDNTIAIGGPDSYTAEALISVGASSSAVHAQSRRLP
jgi:adhesin/invasin